MQKAVQFGDSGLHRLLCNSGQGACGRKPGCKTGATAGQSLTQRTDQSLTLSPLIFSE